MLLGRVGIGEGGGEGEKKRARNAPIYLPNPLGPSAEEREGCRISMDLTI